MAITMPKTVKEWAAEYIAAGFSLCAITKGRKAPLEDGWEKPENYKNPDDFRPGQGIGLVHGPSNTCTIDLDDMVKAEPYFMTHGVDIQALLDAPDAVRISSGRENRAKLVYRVPEGTPRLKTYKIVGCGVELRCRADASDGSQDVLPPTIHPDTGNPYVWLKEGSFNNLPDLPKEIIALWLSLGNKSIIRNSSKSDLDIPQELTTEDWFCINSALAVLSPDDYDLWFKVGIALYPYENGFDVWDEWSGKSIKYSSVKAMDKWFHLEPRENDPITYKSIFEWAFEYEGWVNPAKGVSKATLSKQVLGEAVAQEEKKPFDEEDSFGEEVNIGEDAPPYVPVMSYLGDLIPEGAVSLVSGAGGTGKSYCCLNKAVCIALGRPYGDLPVTQAVVVFISAEDNADILRARLNAICRAFGVSRYSLKGKLFLRDATKEKNISLFTTGPTTALTKIAKYVNNRKANVVFLDNISNLYGGDENNRAEVASFMHGISDTLIPAGLTLREQAISTLVEDFADSLAGGKRSVVLLGHTSKSGSTTGPSGSTGWQNGVRAVSVIKLMDKDNREEKNLPARTLETLTKANYSATGSIVVSEWRKGELETIHMLKDGIMQYVEVELPGTYVPMTKAELTLDGFTDTGLVNALKTRLMFVKTEIILAFCAAEDQKKNIYSAQKVRIPLFITFKELNKTLEKVSEAEFKKAFEELKFEGRIGEKEVVTLKNKPTSAYTLTEQNADDLL